MCARSDPWRAVVAWTPFFPIATGLSFWAARSLLSAIFANDDDRVVRAAAVFALAMLLATVLGRIGNTTRVRLVELCRLEYDRRILTAMLAVPHIEHFEDAEHLDRLEILRTRVQDVVHAPRQIGWLVDGGGGMIVSIALLITIRPALALLVLTGVPSLLVNARAQRRIDAVRTAEAARSRRTLHLFDLATTSPPAKEIRVAGMARELLDRYEREWRAGDAVLAKAEVRVGIERGLAGLAAVAAFGVALAVLVAGARSGDVAPGDVFITLGLMTSVVGQVGGAASGVTSAFKSIGVVEQLVLLEDVAAGAQREQAARQQRAPDHLDHGINLDHVSFRYPGTDRNALTDISLHLTSGSVVALVGDNGAGKSSLVKLLYSLYEPTGGSITIDGVDLQSIPSADWRDRTSACFQDYLNLEFIAQESIGAGDLADISDIAHVSAAAQRASATDVIDRLPAGLDTQLGARLGGEELSGGQWQKLAIARAMMRTEPLLLVLDEPTASLDPLAEHELFDQYALTARRLAAKTGAITILVSHRFSTVGIADLIVVLDRGQIIEQGSHDQLMATGGLYAELYELQARHYR
jgi:ATP-binding cassette subfamily B protein